MTSFITFTQSLYSIFVCTGNEVTLDTFRPRKKDSVTEPFSLFVKNVPLIMKNVSKCEGVLVDRFI